MKKTKLFAAMLCSLSLVAGSALPVFADGTRVVTLGADLSQEQRQTMFRYFNVNPNDVQVMYITNQDEREHLGGYVPMEQIGTRTVSCVYVKPTSTGGIKVKTANLNWVTGNMIATTLSTSGVKNCEVIAACPFEVSGTGALTGVQMAYESATGTTLDSNKKAIATQELVVTGNLANEVGTAQAVNVVNQAKIEVIENNIVNNTEITNVVNNIVQETNVNISVEQVNQIVNLMQQIAEEDYDYDDVKDTLEHVDENVNPDAEVEETVPAMSQEEALEAEASILDDVDTSALGDDIVQSSTEDMSLEEETYTDNTDEGWDVYTDDSDSVSGQGDGWESGAAVQGLTDQEVAEKLAALSEQAESQYDKLKDFCDGEFLDDQEAMDRVYPYEDVTPSFRLNDREVAEKLSKAILDEYLTILADGTDSYIYTGQETYFSTELNMMVKFLKDLFAVDPAEAVQGDADLLKDYTQEEREALYKDVVRFFETLYGEVSDTDTSYAEPSAEEAYSTDGDYGYNEDYAEYSYDEYAEDEDAQY